VLHKPSWKELRGVRDGLAELEVQSILSAAFGHVLLHNDCLMFVQHAGEISNVWLFYLRDLPTLILVPALLNSKTKNC
jgi:hypothetical protein